MVLDVLDSGQLLKILERYELELEIIGTVISGADQGNQVHQKAEIMLLKLLDVLQQLGLDCLFQSPTHWEPRQNDGVSQGCNQRTFSSLRTLYFR